jgi:hypothetical protein
MLVFVAEDAHHSIAEVCRIKRRKKGKRGIEKERERERER